MSSAYVVCATPRTGSTWLCHLLSSTQVLGRPESYFREPDETTWAQRLGLPISGGRVRDYRDFVQSVRGAGTTTNGIFAARLMWGSLARIIEGLGKSAGQSDLGVIQAALGRVLFIYLRREDAIAQAVSWCRAEQTGFWHPGDVEAQPPEEDLDQLKALVETIREHNLAWESWFDSHQVRPHQITYEELVNDPREVIEGIATRLDVVVAPEWQPTSPYSRQTDETNQEWAKALRTALDG